VPDPAGPVLRRAVADDAQACAQVHVRGWQQHYAHLSAGVAALTADERAPRWRELLDDPSTGSALVLVDAGRVRGLVRVVETECRLALLYLYADAQGGGWGGLLHDAGLGLLREAGCDRARLWVLEANDRARGFYAARGWRPDGRRQQVDVAGADLPEVGLERAL
jgi:GNAT superfamily N-acetyltransferase